MLKELHSHFEDFWPKQSGDKLIDDAFQHLKTGKDRKSVTFDQSVAFHEGSAVDDWRTVTSKHVRQAKGHESRRRRIEELKKPRDLREQTVAIKEPMKVKGKNVAKSRMLLSDKIEETLNNIENKCQWT